jgi:hypothetical protein
MTDSFELITGISITIVTPALVEIAKRLGMPVKHAGFAAIAVAIVLYALGEIALGTVYTASTFSRWILAGMVYGLAAAGLYSQTRFPGPTTAG